MKIIIIIEHSGYPEIKVGVDQHTFSDAPQFERAVIAMFSAVEYTTKRMLARYPVTQIEHPFMELTTDAPSSPRNP